MLHFFMSEGEERLTLRGHGSGRRKSASVSKKVYAEMRVGGGNPRKPRKKFTRKWKWRVEIHVTPEKLAGAPKKWYFIL